MILDLKNFLFSESSILIRSGFSCLIYSVQVFFLKVGLGHSKVFFLTTKFSSVELFISSQGSVLINNFLAVNFFLNGSIIPGNKLIFPVFFGLDDLGLFLIVVLLSLNSLAFTFGLECKRANLLTRRSSSDIYGKIKNKLKLGNGNN